MQLENILFKNIDGIFSRIIEFIAFLVTTLMGPVKIKEYLILECSPTEVTGTLKYMLFYTMEVILIKYNVVNLINTSYHHTTTNYL